MLNPNSIVGNQNLYLSWQRTECRKYTITNIDTGSSDIDILITNDEDSTYSEAQTLIPGASVDITLPSDGVFNFSATIILEGVTYSDLLLEACDLIACFQKLMNEKYCDGSTVIVDPCEKLNCPPEACGDPLKEKQVTAALNQLSAMIFVVIINYFNYYLSGIGLTHNYSEGNLSVVNVKKSFTKINKFTKACGFSCDEGSSTSITTACGTCN